MKRLVVWGLGNYLINLINEIDIDCVDYFVDSNAKEKKSYYKGKQVISPECADFTNCDVIVATNKFFVEISNKLIFEYGVSSKNIFLLEDYVGQKENCFPQELSSKYLDRLVRVRDFFIRYNLCDYSKKQVLITNLLLEELLNYDSSTYNDEINIAGCIYKCNIKRQDINIFVVTHKNYVSINENGYKTIMAGCALHTAGKFIGDNTGDEISYLNSKINECTALYWMWKNGNSEYVGLNHYRRYFESPINPKWMVQKWEIDMLLSYYDIIVANPVYFKKSVVETLKDQICKDAFKNCYHVLSKLFESGEAKGGEYFERFINGHYMFPCQMFIMRRTLLDEYCSWLFPIIFKIVDRLEIDEGWDNYSKRVIGFWAERLFTVWINMTEYNIVTLPILKTDNEPPYAMNME